jgi:hypothetical protein
VGLGQRVGRHGCGCVWGVVREREEDMGIEVKERRGCE